MASWGEYVIALCEFKELYFKVFGGGVSGGRAMGVVPIMHSISRCRRVGHSAQEVFGHSRSRS